MYEYRGKKLIEYAIQAMKPVAREILISTNNPGDYAFTGFKTIPDIYPNHGPLSGIHSGLSNSLCDWNLIVGCDMPSLTITLFEFILANANDYQVVYPTHNGFTESMMGFYNRSSLPVIETALKHRTNKILSAVAPLKVLFLNVDDQDFYDFKIFRNINSIEDLDF